MIAHHQDDEPLPQAHISAQPDPQLHPPTPQSGRSEPVASRAASQPELSVLPDSARQVRSHEPITHSPPNFMLNNHKFSRNLRHTFPAHQNARKTELVLARGLGRCDRNGIQRFRLSAAPQLGAQTGENAANCAMSRQAPARIVVILNLIQDPSHCRADVETGSA